MSGYPIELNLNGKTAMVVGLGPVGRRKAESLAAAGARVIGVDPAAGAFGFDLPAGIEVVAESYHADLLHGVSLVIAAGPEEVNRQVATDAQRIGVWVCSTSPPGIGDFAIPAVWKSGPLVLTVSTSGASPALARVLRDRAAQALGPATAGLVELLAELRPLVLHHVPDPVARRRIFRDWAHPRWLSLWMEQGPDAVRQVLIKRIESYK